MYIKINSNNDELMSILNKNPSTDDGLYLKPLKNGHVVGNIVDKNNYEVIFEDSKNSYTDYSENSMDYKSMCSPMVLIDIMTSLFRHLLKSKEEVMKKEISWLNSTIKGIDNDECEMKVPLFLIDSNWFRDDSFLLERYIEGLRVENIRNNLYELTIKKPTVVDLINTASLVGFLTAMSNNWDYYVEDSQVKKYARVLANTNPPYFCWYIFIKNLVSRSKKLSEELIPFLEEKYIKYNSDEVIFTPFDTHTDRVNWCSDKIEADNVLIFGCGEFKLEKRIRKSGFNMISYDIEEDYGEYHKILLDRYDIDEEQWSFTSDFEELIRRLKNCKNNVDIVISEVIEHIEDLEDFDKQLNRLLNTKKVNKVIITTPNKAFNKHYRIEGFRHEDHVIEFNLDNLKTFFSKYECNMHVKEINFFGIGDALITQDNSRVRNSVTLGVIIDIEEIEYI